MNGKYHELQMTFPSTWEFLILMSVELKINELKTLMNEISRFMYLEILSNEFDLIYNVSVQKT